MNRVPFVQGQYYHLYNHAVEDLDIICDEADADRFVLGLKVFNSKSPIGSIYEQSVLDPDFKTKFRSSEPLVSLLCYCLNPNHFHLIVEPIIDGGVSEFMKRVGGGFTMYYNEKYKRKGVLFRGTFKSRHINSDNYLLRASAYVNLNNRVHKLGGETSKLVRSSWSDYVGKLSGKDTAKGGSVGGVCNPGFVLDQFRSRMSYQKFAVELLKVSQEKKKDDVEWGRLLMD